MDPFCCPHTSWLNDSEEPSSRPPTASKCFSGFRLNTDCSAVQTPCLRRWHEMFWCSKYISDVQMGQIYLSWTTSLLSPCSVLLAAGCPGLHAVALPEWVPGAGAHWSGGVWSRLQVCEETRWLLLRHQTSPQTTRRLGKRVSHHQTLYKALPFLHCLKGYVTNLH